LSGSFVGNILFVVHLLVKIRKFSAPQSIMIQHYHMQPNLLSLTFSASK